LDDDLKEDILGARRQILFIEGGARFSGSAIRFARICEFAMDTWNVFNAGFCFNATSAMALLGESLRATTLEYSAG
jgi:hypothetical protein